MKTKLEILFDLSVESELAKYHAINEILTSAPENLRTGADGGVQVAVYTNDDPAKAQEALNNMTTLPNVAPILNPDEYGRPQTPTPQVAPPAPAGQPPVATVPPPAVAPPAQPAPAATDFKQVVKAAVSQTPPPAVAPPQVAQPQVAIAQPATATAGPPPAAAPAQANDAELGKRIRQLLSDVSKLPGMSPDQAKLFALNAAGVQSFQDMSPELGKVAIGALENLLVSQTGAMPAAPVEPPRPAPIQPPAPVQVGAGDLLV